MCGLDNINKYLDANCLLIPVLVQISVCLAEQDAPFHVVHLDHVVRVLGSWNCCCCR